MGDIFRLRLNVRPTRDKYELNLEVPKANQVRFGIKNFKSLDSKLWNSLLNHINSAENLMQFWKIIKQWDGTDCSCRFCNILKN